MKTLTLEAADLGKGSLVLINPSHPLKVEPAAEDLVPVRPGDGRILMQSQAAGMLARITDRLGCGLGIMPVSGYRTGREQRDLYADSVLEHGEKFTRKYVAIPGCSEHQSGYAVDLAENRPDIDPIRPDFPDTGICRTFREMAARYGFIERYPAGREEVTKIAHEPWHFRYVGRPHSELMRESGLTLEEYTDYVKRFSCNDPCLRVVRGGREYEIFYVPVKPGRRTDVEVPDGTPYGISGNNEAGFVVTLGGGPA